MIFAYALIVAAAAVGWLRPRRREPIRGSAHCEPWPDRPASLVVVALVCASIVASLVATIAFEDAQAFHVVRVGTAIVRLPIGMIGDGFPAPRASAVALSLALVQTGLLAVLARVVDRTAAVRFQRAVLLAAAVLALAVAARGPVMTSSDLYSYVGQARAADAYRPIPNGPSIVDRTLSAAFDGRIAPSPYGPLWIAVSRAAIAPFRSLAGELEAARLIGLAGFVASLLALRRLGLGRAALACFALNPALLQQFVIDGHNDVVGLALVLWACAVSSLPLAVALVAAAAAVKLPFALIGAVAFVRPGPLVPRIAAWLCAIGLAAGSYLAIAGRDLRYGLDASAHTYVAPGGFFAASHVAATGVALAALGLALVARRWIPAAAWSMLAFGFIPVPWYLAGCVPYAARAGRPTAFLIALPIAAAVLSRTFIVDRIADGLVPAVVGAAALWLVAREALRLASRRQAVRVGTAR